MRKKLDYEYCSASPILEWLGDKWALVVLLKLHENGVIRFNELYKTIPSISEKMLSTVLRSLVTDGLVGRKIYPSVPPKVEYYVSEFGETLIPHLERLKQWGQENFETIMENRQKQVLKQLIVRYANYSIPNQKLILKLISKIDIV